VLEDDDVSDVALPHDLGGIHDGGGRFQCLGIASHDIAHALLLRDPRARRHPCLLVVCLSLIHGLSPPCRPGWSAMSAQDGWSYRPRWVVASNRRGTPFTSSSL